MGSEEPLKGFYQGSNVVQLQEGIRRGGLRFKQASSKSIQALVKKKVKI